MNDLYNSTIKIIRSNKQASIFRVYPDMPIRKYIPGQYGSLGLKSDKSDKLVNSCIVSLLIFLELEVINLSTALIISSLMIHLHLVVY